MGVVNNSDTRPYEKVELLGSYSLVDTGACENLIETNFANHLEAHRIETERTNVTMRMADGARSETCSVY